MPSLATKNLSGGPNTAINLAYRLAAKGVTIRLISTDVPPDTDTALFWRHVRALAETGEDHPHADLVDASDRSRKLRIGINDVFMATAWWTAQMAKYAVRHTRHSRFVYLIQDYEPLLHPASTQQALTKRPTVSISCRSLTLPSCMNSSSNAGSAVSLTPARRAGDCVRTRGEYRSVSSRGVGERNAGRRGDCCSTRGQRAGCAIFTSLDWQRCRN